MLYVYLGGGAGGVGTPAASAEYGWMVGGTDEDPLEVWAEGAARVGGLWSISLGKRAPPESRDGLHQG